MNNKLFFLLFIVLLSSPLILAQVELNFAYGKTFDIKRPCFNNGTFCSGVATCNITISYPDGNVLQNNIPMSRNGSFFNRTIPSGLNNQLGNSPTIMSCCDGNDCGADTFDIQITGDGKPAQTFPLQFAVIFFAFLLIGSGLVQDRFRLFKYIGSLLLMVMGVLTLYPGYSFINWTTLMGKGIGFSSIGIGFYFLLEDAFSRDEQQDGLESKRGEFV